MNILDKNVQMEIVLNLSPVDIVKYCSTGKSQYENICNSNTFWRRKLEKDYPQEMIDLQRNGIKTIQNPKKLYMERFASISYKIEKFVLETIKFFVGEKFIKYFTQEYKDDLYYAFLNGYNDILIYDYSENPNDKTEIMHDIMVDDIASLLPNDGAFETTYGQTEVYFNDLLDGFIKSLLEETLIDIYENHLKQGFRL